MRHLLRLQPRTTPQRHQTPDTQPSISLAQRARVAIPPAASPTQPRTISDLTSPHLAHYSTHRQPPILTYYLTQSVSCRLLISTHSRSRCKFRPVQSNLFKYPNRALTSSSSSHDDAIDEGSGGEGVCLVSLAVCCRNLFSPELLLLLLLPRSSWGSNREARGGKFSRG